MHFVIGQREDVFRACAMLITCHSVLHLLQEIVFCGVDVHHDRAAVRSSGWAFVAWVGDEQRADQEGLGCRCDRLGTTLEIVHLLNGRGRGGLLGRQKIGRTEVLLHQKDLGALCLLLKRQFSRIYYLLLLCCKCGKGAHLIRL